ncbi:MAG: DUF4280 domain-containing protein [Oscillospiraceae bacterium]|nr:DUF4280 domain-containing protein [Oscillospiraceae bacterium]
MSTEYVVASAKLSCVCGSRTVGLAVHFDRHITSQNKFVANRSDIRVENIPNFGTCNALQSACVREDASLTPWLEYKDDVIVAGHPAVLKSSILMCSIGGGTISVDSSGQ